MARMTIQKLTLEASAQGNAMFVSVRKTLESSSSAASVQVFVAKETAPMELTVNFHAGEGTASADSVVGIVGEAIGILPTASRGTWHFDGWYTAASGGMLVTEGTLVSADIENLYAHWTEATVITFNANGGTISGATSIYAYQGWPLSESGTDLPTSTGGSSTPFFTGWWTAASGGSEVTADTIYDGTYTTLYAQYAATRDYRYIKLIITENAGDRLTQFSRMEFIDGQGNYFDYPSGVTFTSTNAGYDSAGSPAKILDHSVYTKMALTISPYPATIIYDLGSICLDATTYSRWQAYNANDTASWPGRRPSLQLYLSRNGASWDLADEVPYSLWPTTNYALAFTRTLFAT